jgi:hypothetical protein
MIVTGGRVNSAVHDAYRPIPSRLYGVVLNDVRLTPKSLRPDCGSENRSAPRPELEPPDGHVSHSRMPGIDIHGVGSVTPGGPERWSWAKYPTGIG